MNNIEKGPFVLKKFKSNVLIVFAAAFIISSLSVFFIAKSIISSEVKRSVADEFMKANGGLITYNQSEYKPIISGILDSHEIVYIIKDERVVYSSLINKEANNYRNLALVMAKSKNQKDSLQVKLFIDLGKRVNKYLRVIYIFVIPIMFLFELAIALFAITYLKKLTLRLYSVIDNVKDFNSLGVDFNTIKTYNTDDEAGILSREFDKLSKELVRMRHKERQLVYDASYELKTPLAIIEGNLSLMDKKSYSEEGKNAAKEIIKSSLYSAKALVDDMLDLTHEEIIVKEKLQGENISDILAQVIEDYKIIYGDYVFVTDFDPITYPILKLDFVKLSNILLENAVKYSKDDHKEIEVKLKSKGEKIQLTISDYGIGMERDQVDKVFDKFWRADTSRSRNTGGAGLGLSIAQKICEKYQFKINVSSGPNMGTTVTVELN